MAEHSKIEWCDSTFNPWIGCTKVSPACDHCYAERLDSRGIFGGAHWGPGVPRKRTSPGNWRKPLAWNAQEFVECPACGWRGEWREADLRNGCCPRCNHLPERFKPARRRVFCASLGDWLDKVPVEWRRDLFNLIAATPNLDWLLLTKRIGNLSKMLHEIADMPRPGSHAGDLMAHHWRNGTPPANVWIGATICNQQEADRDIPKLLAVPAAVRFLSIEPMLGPVDLLNMTAADGRAYNALSAWMTPGKDPLERRIDWIIAGGESGPQARPSHPEWFRSLRDQCKAAGVPFLFKQWGEWIDYTVDDKPTIWVTEDGRTGAQDDVVKDGKHWWLQMSRVGKSAAGRLLDGETHNGFPEGNR
ncbi:phage Gp37/Gp68 family protein [Pseudazoarcus pumilus]|uniref:Phage Gp37/Gp68 family protein n=1 Tax=Pseudazoarcus pumilus TaxID=2067960 RepID=A0A2I6S874_9RHOO|nr:phage Gp37/Gp68 family protein [Pseudazoarcus pumilus]AUN95437.1 hypothetical protein C0099_11160 [Pseudazoarcus pumilus]